MSTELLRCAVNGANCGSPPGSMTAETPITPGSPLGYWYSPLHFGAVDGTGGHRREL
jgi:hypothetical protein